MVLFLRLQGMPGFICLELLVAQIFETWPEDEYILLCLNAALQSMACLCEISGVQREIAWCTGVYRQILYFGVH